MPRRLVSSASLAACLGLLLLTTTRADVLNTFDEITGDLTARVRAERSGLGSGRTYTITVESRDFSGNVSTRTVTVQVPLEI